MCSFSTCFVGCMHRVHDFVPILSGFGYLVPVIYTSCSICGFVFCQGADTNLRDYNGKKAKQYLKNSASSRSQRKLAVSRSDPLLTSHRCQQQHVTSSSRHNNNKQSSVLRKSDYSNQRFVVPNRSSSSFSIQHLTLDGAANNNCDNDVAAATGVGGDDARAGDSNAAYSLC